MSCSCKPKVVGVRVRTPVQYGSGMTLGPTEGKELTFAEGDYSMVITERGALEIYLGGSPDVLFAPGHWSRAERIWKNCPGDCKVSVKTTVYLDGEALDTKIHEVVSSKLDAFANKIGNAR